MLAALCTIQMGHFINALNIVGKLLKTDWWSNYSPTDLLQPAWFVCFAEMLVFSEVVSTQYRFLVFFLNNAALVITTVAVIKLC